MTKLQWSWKCSSQTVKTSFLYAQKGTESSTAWAHSYWNFLPDPLLTETSDLELMLVFQPKLEVAYFLHMAEIFLDRKNQANFSFSNKRARYISRNSYSNSSLILALSYRQPWRYRDIIHTHTHSPPASWHTESKTTLLLRHAISML